MDKSSKLWEYLSPEEKDLISDSEYLSEQAKASSRVLTDYSYIVFPVSKAYEGFLKKIMLDLEVINQAQYESDHFRIGKALNPFIEPYLKAESYFDKICEKLGTDLANTLWDHWKKGRNLLFHYFPNHLQCIRLTEAEEINKGLLAVMEKTINQINITNQDKVAENNE